jgi:hypothetical protein
MSKSYSLPSLLSLCHLLLAFLRRVCLAASWALADLRLVRRNLIERGRDFHIVVDDVSITHLTFGTLSSPVFHPHSHLISTPSSPPSR